MPILFISSSCKCALEYRAYDVFKKMIGVRGYIGVKNYCKALLFVKNVFQNLEPFLGN